MASNDRNPSVIDRADAPPFFKAAAVLTLSLGTIMHLGSIVVGREAWVRGVMNPNVDALFGIIVTIASIAGVLSWKQYCGGRAGRWLFGFVMFLFLISIPIHGKSALTRNTDYMLAFPIWYSMLEVPLFLVMIYAVSRLRFGPTAR